MIIDSHLYCFEPIDTAAGFASAEDRLKRVQVGQAGHHQSAIRVRDRSPASAQPLNPAGGWNLSQVPDVNFRVDHEKGRVLWTVDGEDFTKYQFPPGLRDLQFSPHCAVCEMDYAGVDVALIHTDPTLGRDSAYLGRCVKQYPDRLRSMVPVDEWRVLQETDVVIGELETAIKTHGLHAIKICPDLFYVAPGKSWDDGPYRPFWQAATALNVPVFFTLGCGPDSIRRNLTTEEARQGYLHDQRTLIRWMQRYPDNVCSLTHGFHWRLYLDDQNRISLDDDSIWLPFENPNCNLEVCFPVRLGDLYDFPYREVWPMLEQMLERIGADHLLWGTDMPFQNRFCTYRQSRDWIEKYCDFLTPQDKASILGGTAARILSLDS